MRLRIVRPLPDELEGLDVRHLRFGASYEIRPPLSDVLLASGYGIPEDKITNPATADDRPHPKHLQHK